MPRAERPLEAEDTELGSFAADLRRLREKAGKPAYRELASRAHYSAATLSDAAGGRKLPSLAVTLAYVTACGGDAEEWEQRWRAIAAPPDPTSRAPYVGLQAFQSEDADRFFGREKLTAKLVDLVGRRGFVGVFGASGSGKSSLLRAGLVPRLESALVFTPGVHPVDECAVRLAQLTGESAVALREELKDPAALGLRIKQYDEDLVLVVDQFEEVFTLCGPEQRDWFITALVNTSHVVIGVRADFCSHVGRHPELVEALEGAQLLVGPMTTDELRRAITEPARRVEATVESALVTRLVADVAGEAAALPLVQHALVETWHRRRGMTLSLVGYEEAGGVEHAIARTAEAVFNDLTAEQQVTARRIFLRLIALGEGTEDTKRRATRSDLDADVLERLATARLVTLTEQHAALTHEALIRSWPRLREWIAGDRAALRVHHQLTEAAAEWDGHDPDALYRGVRLAQARDLDQDSLTAPERAFLHAGLDLDQARQAAARRGARRLRVLVSVLSVLVVLLGGTVVFAVDRAREATSRRVGDLARSVAAQVGWMVPREPGRALRIALAAYRVAPSDETRDALLTASAANKKSEMAEFDVTGHFSLTGGRFLLVSNGLAGTRLLDGPSRSADTHLFLPANLVSLSGDGRRMLLHSEQDGIRLVDVTERSAFTTLATVPPLGISTPLNRTGDVFAGSLMVGNAAEDKVRVWYLDGPGKLRDVPLAGANVRGIELSEDGTKLALIRQKNNEYARAEIWRLDGSGPRPVATWDILRRETFELEFSPDGNLLVVRNDYEGTLNIWDVSDPANVTTWAELPDRATQASRLTALEFSSDGHRLAVMSDQSVSLWDVEHRNAPRNIATFTGFAEQVLSLDYWPSNDEFVAMTSGNWLWRLRARPEKVIEESCWDGKVAELDDGEWARYFPDVERVPVC